LYQQGRGVAADTNEALFWFLVAARRGDTAAAGRARTLERNMALRDVEQARARAAQFQSRDALHAADGEAPVNSQPPNATHVEAMRTEVRTEIADAAPAATP